MEIRIQSINVFILFKKSLSQLSVGRFLKISDKILSLEFGKK